MEESNELVQVSDTLTEWITPILESIRYVFATIGIVFGVIIAYNFFVFGIFSVIPLAIMVVAFMLASLSRSKKRSNLMSVDKVAIGDRLLALEQKAK